MAETANQHTLLKITLKTIQNATKMKQKQAKASPHCIPKSIFFQDVVQMYKGSPKQGRPEFSDCGFRTPFSIKMHYKISSMLVLPREYIAF